MSATPDSKDGNILPTEQRIEEFYKLVDGIEIAMMTTRLADGSLVSRPMATQARREGTDLWFVTSTDTLKAHEIEKEPNVNLSYYKDAEWVSVSGRARLNRDRALIHSLYKVDWRAWFGDEGGEKNGGPDDPRLVLIDVKVQTASYFKRTHSRPVMLLSVVKAVITGEPPDLGETQHIRGADLRAAQRRGEG